MNGVNLLRMPYIIAPDLTLRTARGQEKFPGANRGHEQGRQRMGRMIKLVALLGILGVAGLSGYAYLVDMAPTAVETRQPVTLDAD